MNKVFYSVNGKKIGVYLRDEADHSVAAEIFKLKEYRRVEEKIKQGTVVVIDAGAHSGMFTLYVRALNPKAQIVAVEPEAKNLALLKKHLAENKISKVKIIAGALAGESGERFLKISADSHNHQLSAKGEKLVNAFSFSDLVKTNKIKKVSLLKMDIEGAEYEVLESLSAEDWLKTEALILEYHPTFAKATARQSPADSKRLEKLLRENGFGVEVFPSKFDKSLGFIYAQNKRIK